MLEEIEVVKLLLGNDKYLYLSSGATMLEEMRGVVRPLNLNGCSPIIDAGDLKKCGDTVAIATDTVFITFAVLVVTVAIPKQAAANDWIKTVEDLEAKSKANGISLGQSLQARCYTLKTGRLGPKPSAVLASA